jgi:hypothetical protein
MYPSARPLQLSNGLSKRPFRLSDRRLRTTLAGTSREHEVTDTSTEIALQVCEHKSAKAGDVLEMRENLQSVRGG